MGEPISSLAASELAIPPTAGRWMEFISGCREANIFHHPAWIHVIGECYSYKPFVLAIPDSSGHIAAGIPFAEIHNVSGKRWIALPFTDHCSPLFTDDESCRRLAQAIDSLYHSGGIPRIAVRWDGGFLPAAQRVSEHVLHTLELDADPGRILGRLHATHRRNIKVAQNSGLRVEWGTDQNALRQFYRLHLETRHRQGVPIQPWHFFELLGKELLEPGFGFVLSAYLGEECVASSIFLHWHHTLMYKYGASQASAFLYRPNNLLMWTAIQWGCENGYTRFDLGRTDLKNTGLRRFKTGFGAREEPLTYSVLADHPVQGGTGALTGIMHAVIRRSPLWFCQALGQALYRYSG